MNFPVPVLAEPDKVITPNRTGKARDGTVTVNGKLARDGITRGGENFRAAGDAVPGEPPVCPNFSLARLIETR
jgi:hypothetical protein